MLAGVSPGVIGVDAAGLVTIANPSIERTLGLKADAIIGKPLVQAVPELQAILPEGGEGRLRALQQQIQLTRDGRERTVTVRVTSEQAQGGARGFVVTLDDITDLVTAQRTSAWADVARRIAHEIKNPLTPIQLSAERIRRKYGKVIVADKDVFDQCTATIIRQVDEIKRMVDEFSSFARMPKPAIARNDLSEIAKQNLFMMRVAHPDMEFGFTEAGQDRLHAAFDIRLLSQAITNILKNAVEAVFRRARGRTGQRPSRSAPPRRGGVRGDRDHRQRQRLPRRGAPAAARALYEPPARAAPGSGSRSSARCSKSMAVASN